MLYVDVLGDIMYLEAGYRPDIAPKSTFSNFLRRS
jgi:hypothetical protein